MHCLLSFISVMVVGLPMAESVVAHAGEFHGQPSPVAPAEPATTQDGEAVTSTPATSIESTNPETLVEPLPAAVGQLPVIAGIPAGVGESLLTVLIAFPWILIGLRTQVRSRSRS